DSAYITAVYRESLWGRYMPRLETAIAAMGEGMPPKATKASDAGCGEISASASPTSDSVLCGLNEIIRASKVEGCGVVYLAKVAQDTLDGLQRGEISERSDGDSGSRESALPISVVEGGARSPGQTTVAPTTDQPNEALVFRVAKERCHPDCPI